MVKTQANTEALKEALLLVGDLVTTGVDLTDGFQLSDLGDLIKDGKDLPAVIKDASLIVPEYLALDDAAKADLLAWLPANVKVPGHVNVEMFLQTALTVVVQLQGLVEAVAQLIDQLKHPVQPL